MRTHAPGARSVHTDEVDRNGANAAHWAARANKISVLKLICDKNPGLLVAKNRDGKGEAGTHTHMYKTHKHMSKDLCFSNYARASLPTNYARASLPTLLHTHMQTHAPTHPPTHACTHARIHASTHPRARTHTHTHTHLLSLPLSQYQETCVSQTRFGAFSAAKTSESIAPQVTQVPHPGSLSNLRGTRYKRDGSTKKILSKIIIRDRCPICEVREKESVCVFCACVCVSPHTHMYKTHKHARVCVL